jgi:hypothetical protein
VRLISDHAIERRHQFLHAGIRMTMGGSPRRYGIKSRIAVRDWNSYSGGSSAKKRYTGLQIELRRA